MLFLVITSNKGKHKVITLYNDVTGAEQPFIECYAFYFMMCCRTMIFIKQTYGSKLPTLFWIKIAPLVTKVKQ